MTNCSVFGQLQFSEVLVKWRRFFNFLAAQQGKSEMMVLEQKLELEQLKVCLAVDVSRCVQVFVALRAMYFVKAIISCYLCF